MSRAPSTRWWLQLLALPSTAALAGTHGYRHDTVHSRIVSSFGHDGYSRPCGHRVSVWMELEAIRDGHPASADTHATKDSP